MLRDQVKVWLGESRSHYYVLSRFLISRMLTLSKIPYIKVGQQQQRRRRRQQQEQQEQLASKGPLPSKAGHLPQCLGSEQQPPCAVTAARDFLWPMPQASDVSLQAHAEARGGPCIADEHWCCPCWQAVKIALEVKKYLVDHSMLDVTQVSSVCGLVPYSEWCTAVVRCCLC
jgi:hypothetical protein